MHDIKWHPNDVAETGTDPGDASMDQTTSPATSPATGEDTPVERLARLLHVEAEEQRDAADIHEDGTRPWDRLSVGEQRGFRAAARRIRDALDGTLSDTYPAPVTTRGYDDAETTPVGATVTRVYFCEPGHYTKAAGDEHDSYADALEAAIVRHQQAEARRREFHHGQQNYLPLPERFSVDVRWTLTWPADPAAGIHSSGTDTVARRTTYDTLSDGLAHLDRLRRNARA